MEGLHYLNLFIFLIPFSSVEIDKKELEELELIYRGYLELLEKAKKTALEENLEFLEKEGKELTPEEFVKLAMDTNEVSNKYTSEVNRYKGMLLEKISKLTGMDLSNAEIVKFIGIPKAPINKFEIKINGKKEIVVINKNKRLVEILEE